MREIARELNLKTKDKKDSQGICFVGEVDLRQFLSQYIKDKPGDIIDLDSGKKLVGMMVWLGIQLAREKVCAWVEPVCLCMLFPKI